MCLSTIYMDSGNGQNEIMKDVAKIEAEGKGFWFIDLFGERTFVEGTIQCVNLVGGSFIILKNRKTVWSYLYLKCLSGIIWDMKKVIITHDERNYQRLKRLVKGPFPEVDISLARDDRDRKNNIIDQYLDMEISKCNN